jgi:tetratricopeptide (TPR) repeat protein
MKKLNKAQIATILFGGFFILILFVLPKIQSGAKEEVDVVLSEDHEESHNHDIREGVELNESAKKKVADLENQLSNSKSLEEKLIILDSLINFASSEKQPVLMAEFFKEKAVLTNTEEDWTQAGDVFFKTFRFAKSNQRVMIEEAIQAFEKVLEMNPSNLQAKTALGVCYVEGAGQLGEMPMKGIGILMEVLEVDSNNIDALINLGYFSIQSTQYEKAIQRFNKVLEIDPENAEAYLYLTDLYVQMGEIEKGLSYLEKYKSFQKDPLVIQQVDTYIEELKIKK